MMNPRSKNFIGGLIIGAFLVIALLAGALADRVYDFTFLDKIFPRATQELFGQKVLTEESVTIDVAKKVSPSVVTVSIQTPQRRVLTFNPFGGGFSQRIEGGQPQDIGTGFVVSKDGLIVTNKHVVSDTNSTYKVIMKDGSEYEAKQISRDPSNDIAVIKIDASNLTPVSFGDSNSLQVGQYVVAIGTALGEFRDTVTQGVISGLGRGIQAGDAYLGYVETLDNVIQTDAAINPGNSGGPLVNSAGQVIGINVAVAQGAQNIGFAIPIDVVSKALDQYKTNGKFASKPYLGVEYQMVSKQAAILNDVPQGAYVVNVVAGSPAEKAGIKSDDIVVKIDNSELNDKNTLADVIAKKKAGDTISLETWRDGETLNLSATLSEFSE